MKTNHALCTASLLGALAASQAQLVIRPSPLIDVGEFPAESVPTASFELVNTGSESLPITGVKSDCHCFNPTIYTKRIPARGSTPLDVFIDAGLLDGPFEKTVRVRVGGKNATNAVLTVKGTVHHAILGIPRFMATDRTAIHQPWSTNLLFTLRKDLSETPTLRLGGHPQFEGKLVSTKNSRQFNLHLCMPAQQQPLYWESRVVLSFDQTPAIRSTMIKINGYAGGTLHPSIQKLSGAKKRTSITLQRIYPVGTPHQPAPLRCNHPGVSIKETHGTQGQSTVEFSFSEGFLQQLANEGRITISLATDGFIPTTLVVEK